MTLTELPIVIINRSQIVTDDEELARLMEDSGDEWIEVALFDLSQVVSARPAMTSFEGEDLDATALMMRGTQVEHIVLIRYDEFCNLFEMAGNRIEKYAKPNR